MNRLNYISTWRVEELSGGWTAVNHHLHAQLGRRFEIHPLDGIDAPFVFHEKLLSKAMRTAGLKGIFAGYSTRRLDSLARLAEAGMDPTAAFNVFHGATPWLHVRCDKPYVCYVDSCFGTYMSVYHDAKAFDGRQLESLCAKEADFLSRAKAVFFNSQWALDDCRRRYGIVGDNLHDVGLGGAFPHRMDPVTPAGDPYFLFTGYDFMGKGGEKAVNAFEKLQARYPECRLLILGQKPPERYLRNSRVEYIGSISKSSEDGLRRIIELFSGAVCFLLPTSRDLVPLVLLEASSVGCPVISTRKFGIPELVVDGVTGFLLEPERIDEQLADCMERIYTDPALRSSMGSEGVKHVMSRYTWDIMGDRILSILSDLRESGAL
jgi:glycosyltransferase involved in cell wall biosynthesis